MLGASDESIAEAGAVSSSVRPGLKWASVWALCRGSRLLSVV